MPIVIKDYTWNQSSTNIQLRVPIPSVYTEKVDLFSSDCYIKANFSPFFFELFLMHDVDMTKSKCTIVHENCLLIDLVKKEERIWSDLEKILSKEDKKELRQKILEKCQEKAKNEAENKAIMKSNLARFTVQQAMDIDNKQHIIMDSRRDEECKKAMDQLEIWKNNTNKSSGVKITELPSSEDELSRKKVDVSIASVKQIPKQLKVRSEYVEKKKKETAKRVLPKLRDMAQVEITHTPRSFPTPSRESTAREEDIWLKNITLARRATGFVSEDLRPEEQDPQWCKEKGDEFFRSGNFLGAISAYTHGITLSDKLPSLFANRAAAHFSLGNFNKCANDCSTALDLMKPACEINRRSRGKCIARRAAALARLGYLNKAIDEMKAAAKLLPDDENLKKDIYDMERAWEQDPDSE
ncbi:dynein axonemal assembly factor 4-like [Vanessa cardui]|uniref:dynein axonemal assembly factor 4-like n=1 Tax=Vanessa cardui TaxID=171605 RepID=UPI001F13CF3C|nr:dynein axonemal assembly factor 4-like [Vanessa cardui]